MAVILKDHLQSFLESHQLLSPERAVELVVAFSGGRDSTALLYCLSELKTSFPKLNITVAYYWHPWRPLQHDLQLVHHHCKTLKLSWVMLTPNLTLPKSETAAREDRYQQLANLAADLHASAILTAHHLDDQVETVLFRILRGTGLEGLKGIPDCRMLDVEGQQIPVLRPFVDLPRSELEAYINEKQLRFIEDPTNQNPQFRRNFIRHQVLPKIEESFPQFRQSLVRLADHAAHDLEIVNAKIDEVWRDVYDTESETLDEVRFNQLSQPFQQRILRRFMDNEGLESGYARIEEVLAFLSGKNRKFTKPGLYSLGTNCFLSAYRNRIAIESPSKFTIEPMPVAIPGTISHRELKATITIKPLTMEERLRPIDYKKVPDSQIYVDLSKLGVEALTLRSRNNGDKIHPLGMTAPIKLKRFFINRAIPRFKRDSVPLLALDQDVLWAVGIGISEIIRVKERPTHLITLHQEF